MNNHENKPGDMRAQYASEVIGLLRTAILGMKSSEMIKKVQFGHQTEGGSVWISRDPKAIVDPEEIQVNGVDFYFGLLKSE